jgi:hypothetical protein
MVAPAFYTETLTIAISVNVIGSGVTTTTIYGGEKATVVTIPQTAANVTLSKLTIRNGYGAGIYNAGKLTITQVRIYQNNGGGIQNEGALTVRNSTVEGNINGSGIYNHGTLTMTDTTIRANSTPGNGGGIQNLGTLTMNNSTVSQNMCCQDLFTLGGGGILNLDYHGLLFVNNSTIALNTARHGAGGIVNWNSLVATVSNSTISGNSLDNVYSNGVPVEIQKQHSSEYILGKLLRPRDLAGL